MSQTSEAQNKAIVLEAFDTLFNNELGLPFNEFGSQVQHFGPGPPARPSELGLDVDDRVAGEGVVASGQLLEGIGNQHPARAGRVLEVDSVDRTFRMGVDAALDVPPSPTGAFTTRPSTSVSV